MKCQSHTTKNRNSSHAIKNQNQGKPHQAHNQVIKLKKKPKWTKPRKYLSEPNLKMVPKWPKPRNI